MNRKIGKKNPWPTLYTAQFFALSPPKIDGVELMGIDRGFSYDHYKYVIFHSVKYQIF